MNFSKTGFTALAILTVSFLAQYSVAQSDPTTLPVDRAIAKYMADIQSKRSQFLVLAEEMSQVVCPSRSLRQVRNPIPGEPTYKNIYCAVLDSNNLPLIHPVTGAHVKMGPDIYLDERIPKSFTAHDREKSMAKGYSVNVTSGMPRVVALNTPNGNYDQGVFSSALSGKIVFDTNGRVTEDSLIYKSNKNEDLFVQYYLPNQLIKNGYSVDAVVVTSSRYNLPGSQAVWKNTSSYYAFVKSNWHLITRETSSN
jgi:hypothetical protein